MTDAHAALAAYMHPDGKLSLAHRASDLATALHEALAALAERDADDQRRSEEGRTDWDYEQRIQRAEVALDAANARITALHHPVEIEPSETICRECSFQLPNGTFFGKVIEWPCATVLALSAPADDAQANAAALIESNREANAEQEGERARELFGARARRDHQADAIDSPTPFTPENCDCDGKYGPNRNQHAAECAGWNDTEPPRPQDARRAAARELRDIGRELDPEPRTEATRCLDKIWSTVPSWAGEDQIDPCRCVRPKGHDGGCACSHDSPADAVAVTPKEQS